MVSKFVKKSGQQSPEGKRLKKQNENKFKIKVIDKDPILPDSDSEEMKVIRLNIRKGIFTLENASKFPELISFGSDCWDGSSLIVNLYELDYESELILKKELKSENTQNYVNIICGEFNSISNEHFYSKKVHQYCIDLFRLLNVVLLGCTANYYNKRGGRVSKDKLILALLYCEYM